MKKLISYILICLMMLTSISTISADAQDITAEQLEDLSIRAHFEDEELFDKILNKDCKLQYQSRDVINDFDTYFLSFDTENHDIYIFENIWPRTYGTLTIHVVNRDGEIIDSTEIFDFNNIEWDLYEDIPTNKNSSNAQILIENYINKEYDSRPVDLDDIQEFNIVSRTVNIGLTETMQTYHTFLNSDIEKYGIDRYNSIPIRQYVGISIDNIEGEDIYDAQFTYNIKLDSPITAHLPMAEFNLKRIGITPDNMDKIQMKIVYEGTIYDVPFEMNYDSDSHYYTLTYENDKFPADMVMYNSGYLKGTREVETPIIYAYEDGFDTLYDFAREQLTDDWEVLEGIDQKFYLNYKGDNYLLALVNRSNEFKTDIYQLIETTKIEVPELKAEQKANGDVVVSYKNLEKINKYNDVLNTDNPYFDIGDNEHIAGVVYKNPSIIVDKTNKTWTLKFNDLLTDDNYYVAGENLLLCKPYKFNGNDIELHSTLKLKRVHPKIEISATDFTNEEKDSLYNLFVETYVDLQNVVINNYNYTYSFNDRGEYTKLNSAYNLDSNNSILFNLHLIASGTCDSGDFVGLYLPYDFAGKYIDVTIPLSLDDAKQIGVDITNYKNSSVKVARVHNGQTSILNATLIPVLEEGVITSYKVKFKTDKMSAFAIANSKIFETLNNSKPYKAPDTSVR